MRDRHRTIDRWVMLGLMAYTLGLVAVLVVSSARVTYDDGFYYFAIARQVARGAGSTFDGLHPTNGYHPLWLLCLVPIFWLAPTNETALAWGTILQGVLLAAGAGLLYHIARLRFGRFAASLAALLWVAWTYRLAVSGLEFSLYALGVLAAAYVYLRWFDSAAQPPGAYLAFGLLLGLTFLSRLDTIVLAGAIGLSLGWRELRSGLGRAGVERLLAFGSPLIIVLLAYVGANLWLFGHPFPVSAVVKRTWSAELLAQDPYYQTQGVLMAKIYQLFWPFDDLRTNLESFSLAGGSSSATLGYVFYSLYIIIGTFGAGALFLAGALGQRWVRWHRWFSRILKPWGPFVLFSLLQLLGYALLYHDGLSTTTWYYVIQPCLATLLVAAVIDRLARWRVGRGSSWSWRLLVPIAVAGWFSVPLYPLWGLKQWQDALRPGRARQPIYDTVQWVRDNLPADAVIGAWNAGTIGYLSGRRVVDLDGLVNSWDFGRVKRYDVCGYWREAGITHLVDSFADRHAVSVVPTYPAYAACVDRLELIWAEPGQTPYGRMEIYRIRPTP